MTDYSKGITSLSVRDQKAPSATVPKLMFSATRRSRGKIQLTHFHLLQATQCDQTTRLHAIKLVAYLMVNTDFVDKTLSRIHLAGFREQLGKFCNLSASIAPSLTALCPRTGHHMTEVGRSTKQRRFCMTRLAHAAGCSRSPPLILIGPSIIEELSVTSAC